MELARVVIYGGGWRYFIYVEWTPIVDLFLWPIASDQDPPTGRPLLASVFLLLVGA